MRERGEIAIYTITHRTLSEYDSVFMHYELHRKQEISRYTITPRYQTHTERTTINFTYYIIRDALTITLP